MTAARGRDMGPVSLWARLLTGLLALFVFTLGAFSVVTAVSLMSSLTARLDNQLLLAPPDIVARVCHGPDKPPPKPLGTALRPPPFFLARLDAHGRPVEQCAATEMWKPLRLSDAETARLLAHGGRPVDLPDQTPALRAFARPSETGGWDVLAISRADVNATMSRLVALELLCGAFTVIGAVAIGAGSVRWGLRPLAHMTATARAVATDVTSGQGVPRRRVPQPSTRSEVGKLAEAFNTLLDVVEHEVASQQRSEQRMRQFLADASHELRTPLTSLRGYAELLRMWHDCGDLSSADARTGDALRRLTEEGLRMSRLVEDLLILARSDDQQRSRRAELVRLDTILADTLTDLRLEYPHRDFAVRRTAIAIVRGDAAQLRRILLHVLSNAARHTAPGGPITITLSVATNRVSVTIADHGPGLSPREAAHVFDRFWKADSARTRPLRTTGSNTGGSSTGGGCGIGLSIVDSLVAAHDGTIEFDTDPDHGTTVTIRLPIAIPTPSQPLTPQQDPLQDVR